MGPIQKTHYSRNEIGTIKKRVFGRHDRVLPEDYCKEDPCNFPWGGELARSWPRVGQLLTNSHQLCVQNLALALVCCFSWTKSTYKIRLARSWPEVRHGLPTFDTSIFRVEIAGVFIAVVLWQHPTRFAWNGFLRNAQIGTAALLRIITVVVLGLSLTMGPEMITRTFCYLGLNFPITQDIRYTGLSGRIFCVIGCLSKVLSVNVPITHSNCLVLAFPITPASVTQRNCFQIISVIVSGLIVNKWYQNASREGIVQRNRRPERCFLESFLFFWRVHVKQ